MGEFYAQCALTIIAIAGQKPDYGLPGVSLTPRKPSYRMAAGNLDLTTIPPSKEDEYANSKWASQGWTYQEGLLAQRRLLFTDSQVYFQCAGIHCQENLSLSLQKLHIKDLSRYPDRCAGLFLRFGIRKRSDEILGRIKEYPKREFTYPSDVLDAFRGVLQAFRSLPHPVHHICRPVVLDLMLFHSREQFAFGDMFAFGLCWGFICSGQISRRPHFPSWTCLDWQLGSNCSFEKIFSPKDRLNRISFTARVKWAQKLTWRLKFRSGGLQEHEDFPKFSFPRYGCSSSNHI